MKILILFFAFKFFFVACLWGQQSSIDSIKILLKISKEDSNKVNRLNQLAYIVGFNNSDTAITLSTEALSLSEKINWQMGIGNSYQSLGTLYGMKGNYPMGIQAYQRAIDLWEKMLQSSAYDNFRTRILISKSTALASVGTDYFILGNETKAIDYYFKALKISETMGDSVKMVALLFNCIGHAYESQRNFTQARNYYLQALKIAELIHDKVDIQQCLTGLGVFFQGQNNFDSSQTYLFRALKMSKELNDSNKIAAVFGCLGILYEKQESDSLTTTNRRNDFFNKATDSYSKALLISEAMGNKNGSAMWTGNLGDLYRNRHDYQEALQYYFKTLSIYQSLSNKNGIALWLGNIGALYTEMASFSGNSSKKNLMLNANKYLQQALRLSDSIGVLQYSLNNELALSDFYVQAADYKNALEHYKKGMLIKDSLFNKEKSEKIAEINTKYETEKKDNEIVLLNKDQEIKDERIKQQSKSIFRFSWLAVLLLLTTLFVILLYQRGKTAYNLKVQQMDNKFLRFQLQPHFVKNTLQAIRKFIRLHPEIAEEYFDKYSFLMREVLENSEEEAISLEDEISMLKKYMDLEALRVVNGFDYVFDIDPSIDEETTKVPPLILQPVVENAIWHGISGKTGKGKIFIKISLENRTLQCIVENYCENEDIVQAKDKKNGKSFGLQITRDRLKILSKEKRSKSYLDAIPQLNGMRVQMGIPV